MARLKIDNRELEIDSEMSIVQAAQKLGIEIPVMCYKEGYEHFTSCMICMVKDKTSGKTLPACSARAVDGMEIETLNDEIRGFRKATLELLLSDHLGDCEAPCQRLCTVHHEVPKMIREIMGNQMEHAIATVRRDMAIPAILERYCNAPCEKGCRRAKHDEALSIRELTRFVADWDLQREQPYIPPRKPETGKRVAVIGAGATGLAAAHHLAIEGHAVTVFEKKDRIGGRIETEFKKELLHDWVMAGELRVLRELGIEFQMSTEIGAAISLEQIRQEFSAIIFAGGAGDSAALQLIGLPVTAKGVKVNSATSMTDLPGVFAGGSVLKSGQPLVKSVAAGKSMACLATQFLAGKPMTGLPDMYNHNMGRLLDGELEIFVTGASPIPRLKPDGLELDGYNPPDAQTECTRCLHCDCRKNQDCKLRQYSDEYGAEQSGFKGEERAPYVHINQNAGAVYEPGKCIKCGLCVRVTKKEGEQFGFTFIGRGFDVKPGVSLNKTLAEGLEKVAEKVVEACPTGALSHNEKPHLPAT
jgi:ferredoxin